MTENRQETFLDWIVVTCDRLLESYAGERKSTARENSNTISGDSRCEQQIRENSGLTVKVRQFQS